jgi:hypothetical protein
MEGRKVGRAIEEEVNISAGAQTVSVTRDLCLYGSHLLKMRVN